MLQQKLSDIISNAIEDAFKLENGYNDPPLVACEGLAIEHNGNSWETPGIGLDPLLLKTIAGMGEEVQKLQSAELVEWNDYATTIDELLERIRFLEDMHKKSPVDHVPEIISTREQYEEMKPTMDKEDRVIVHTTFDKALKVL